MKRLHRDSVPSSTEPPAKKRRVLASHHVEKKDASKKGHSSIDESTRNDESQPVYRLGDEKTKGETDSDVQLTLEAISSERRKRTPSIRNIPSGKMDIDTKKQLLEAQRKTPRYLFRGWSNAAGYPYSGGYKGLNTPDAITPLAFFKIPGMSTQIYDLSRKEMLIMARRHLRWDMRSDFKSDFSSWAASLQVAIHFAEEGRKQAYISVLDTSKVENVIIHVPSLLEERMYPHEYLAHGVISGPALKAVPIKAFVDAGLPRGFASGSNIRVGLPGKPFSDADIHAARSVADQYGSEFGAAILTAFLCLKQRSSHLFRNGFDWPKEKLAEALRDYVLPQHLCSDETILTDIVDTEGYGEVEQMIRMLRQVVEVCHGKGARALERGSGFNSRGSILLGH